MIKTTLHLLYAELSWDYDFPEFVESALEEDFIENSAHYDETSMKRVASLLLIDPNPTVPLLLKCARNA